MSDISDLIVQLRAVSADHDGDSDVQALLTRAADALEASARTCVTCGNPNRGTYTGACSVCSQCECVPNAFKERHALKHKTSYWIPAVVV